MGNPYSGEVDLELGGEIYPLKFDWQTIAEIEARFNDRSIEDLFSGVSIPRRVLIESVRASMNRCLPRTRAKTSKAVADLISEGVKKDGTAAFVRIMKVVMGGVAASGGASAEAVRRLHQEIDDAQREDEDAQADYERREAGRSNDDAQEADETVPPPAALVTGTDS